MSRVAKNPVKLPSGVELKIDGRKVSVKGSKGNLEHEVHEQVDVSFEDGIFTVKPREESQESWALAGTTRAVPQPDGSYLVTGHKWFTSAPMSDRQLST